MPSSFLSSIFVELMSITWNQVVPCLKGKGLPSWSVRFSTDWFGSEIQVAPAMFADELRVGISGRFRSAKTDVESSKLATISHSGSLDTLTPMIHILYNIVGINGDYGMA